ncbi:MAG: ATPase, T2SS/T4P/T4SS family [Candidatus Micrarchaeota archaeon]|nr:ATPase, T2SS/T4P/T4SS family [Candidatus Micrarchaeota archaeon]
MKSHKVNKKEKKIKIRFKPHELEHKEHILDNITKKHIDNDENKTTKNQELSEKTNYKIEYGQLIAEVVIKKNPGDHVLTYYLYPPIFDEGTNAILEEVKTTLLKRVNISTQEALNIKLADQLKEKFMQMSKELLRQNLPEADDVKVDIIARIITNQMLGLGDIEYLLRDNYIEEICINGPNMPIWVYHRKFAWLKTNMSLSSDNVIWNLAAAIARGVGRQINNNQPILDAYLSSGDRVNATLFPISYFGNTITIRKFARKPWTITDYIISGTITTEAAALLWEAIQYETNIIVSGGTGAGKTSLLNVLTMFIPPNQRVISIEQTREINLPSYLQWVPLVVREATSEGTGKVTMLDLMVNSLRMRPDRIIVGEIRRAEEAEVLFEAMHTGHSVYATLHAETVEETIRRLHNPPINIPPMLLQSLHLIVAMYRDRRRNVRRAFEIGEVIPSEDRGVYANVIFRWRPNRDQLMPFEQIIRFYDIIKMYANVDDDGIKNDLEEKKTVLEWMAKNNINNIEDVGNIISLYYDEKNRLMDMIRINKVPKVSN